MHDWSIRAGTAYALSVAILVALCAMASYTDTRQSFAPSVELEVLKYGSLERVWNGDNQIRDQVTLLLNVTADLRPVFTWNTRQLYVFVAAEYLSKDTELNQVVLWDTIVEKKEDAVIQEEVLAITKNFYHDSVRDGPFTYPFQGENLQGCKFNLTMSWNLMPVFGALRTDKFVVPGFQLPQHYA